MKRNPVAWAALIVSSAALFSSTGFLRQMPAAPKVTEEGQRTAKALSQAFGAVADFARPSVVQISVQKKMGRGVTLPPGLRRIPNPRGTPGNPGDPGQDLEEMLRKFFTPDSGPQQEQFGNRVSGLGSGFVYDDRGHILTNNHVVEDAEKLTVTFWDGIEVKATVVGTDKQSDVAVIKVDNTSYPPLPRGDSSKLKVGELVVAVGSPFGLSQSVTTGIVSALERSQVGINGSEGYESFIQTDAPINRGNSGGPLLNMDGEVIGVNSAIASGGQGNDGVGFTIPINMARNVAEMLIKDGKMHYARIGVQLGPLTPVIARQLGLDPTAKGIFVVRVFPGSPAEKAGLKEGDVIIGYAGDKVVNGSSFRLKVATSETSKPQDLVYVRDGKERKTSIIPAPEEKVVFDEDKKDATGDSTGTVYPKSEVDGFGLELQPLTSELAKPLGLPTDQKGLLVASVKDGSMAAEEGIQEGDVITKVIKDRKIQPVTSVKDFQDLAAKNEEVSFYVQKGKIGRYVTLSKQHAK
jgi:serine protease Do